MVKAKANSPRGPATSKNVIFMNFFIKRKPKIALQAWLDTSREQQRLVTVHTVISLSAAQALTDVGGRGHHFDSAIVEQVALGQASI